MLPNLEQTNLGLIRARIRENIYKRKEPQAEKSASSSSKQQYWHPCDRFAGCPLQTPCPTRREGTQQHFLYRKLQAKATSANIEVPIPLSFSCHFCDNTCTYV